MPSTYILDCSQHSKNPSSSWLWMTQALKSSKTYSLQFCCRNANSCFCFSLFSKEPTQQHSITFVFGVTVWIWSEGWAVPTSKWCVGDWSVIKEPSSLHSVHPPAFNAHGHSALLTHNHTWWQDDPWHVQRLLFLWVVRDTMEKSKGRVSKDHSVAVNHNNQLWNLTPIYHLSFSKKNQSKGERPTPRKYTSWPRTLWLI